MLIIVCGTSLNVGKATREFFLGKGFEIVQKKSYVSDNVYVKTRYDERNIVSKDEVLKCDFKYEVNGIINGFNKEQIVDAVNGRKNCLLTVTPDTFEFVKEVKAMHGEYVVAVYTYIDERVMRELYTKMEMDDAEYADRLNTGKRLQEFCANNLRFFDDIVVYSGEDSAFDIEHLCAQYDNVINKALAIQKKYNNQKYVQLPYKGNLEYIFASYSHEDKTCVLPVLSALRHKGYRIWYDEGIEKGENWRIFVGEKVKNCKNFLLFSSPKSVESDDVLAEINGALNANKKITEVKMEDCEFPFGFEMYISLGQRTSIDEEDLINNLAGTFCLETREI